MAHTLSVFSTKEIQAELDKRANPKFQEVVYEFMDFLHDNSLGHNSDSDTYQYCQKELKKILYKNNLPVNNPNS
jgi:hypothetical protein